MTFFNLHTHHYTAQPDILELVNQYPDEFDAALPNYSVGIHPWRIDEAKLQEQLDFIESKLADTNCLAIGECGLDKRIETPPDVQSRVFEQQLLLAEKSRKPVVIHCVAAFQEVIEAKKKLGITVPMLIHGFSKNAQTAKQLLDNGFYLSFGKYLLRNPELETVFQSVPANRFFLETDTMEESIRDVYALAAKYRNQDREALQQQIEQNYNTVFQNG